MSGDVTTQIVPLDLTVAPKVLLVDDDPLILSRLELLLIDAGFEVTTACDAATALEALQREFTPVVILDRNMPGMDGLALCRKIRELQWPGYVYLILLTVQDAEDDILAGLEAGADDYLSKRVSAAQLVARLRTARRILGLELSLKTALEERRRMSFTDALTGIYNRRYFVRHLARELQRVKRYGGDVGLLALDIDHFKQINDGHGHAAGDAVLQEFAQRIRAGLPRTSDWCARLGGEEFAVVLPETNLEGAVIVAERLRQSIAAEPVHTDWGSLPVTVSVGAVSSRTFADTEVSVEKLLDRADQCLYQSKQNGRNRVTPAKAGGGSR